MMMIMMIIAVTQLIFKPGAPDCRSREENEDDDNKDNDVTQSIFKLGPPDFAWKQIWIVPYKTSSIKLK